MECQACYKKRDEIIRGLLCTLELIDTYTRKHCERTARYARILTNYMNLSVDEVEHIYFGALFHDLGKIGIPVSILQKNEELKPDEYEIMQQHSENGARILDCFSDFKKIVPFVRHHHEMFDGGGYPDGLVGENIPLGARIIAVADAYDALTSDRFYRKACDKERALEEIKQHAFSQFDPVVVEALCAVKNTL